MKLIVKGPLLDKHMKNKISIYEVQIDRLKNRNGRQEIKLYGKNNKLEYEISFTSKPRKTYFGTRRYAKQWA